MFTFRESLQMLEGKHRIISKHVAVYRYYELYSTYVIDKLAFHRHHLKVLRIIMVYYGLKITFSVDVYPKRA